MPFPCQLLQPAKTYPCFEWHMEEFRCCQGAGGFYNLNLPAPQVSSDVHGKLLHHVLLGQLPHSLKDGDDARRVRNCCHQL